ncbi:hypothetical protein JOF29_006740 [Kribbella aluminosa]|uniref:Uncharacterized protein n=1 Tax=Kribbella aluminosa TaxID=416017 RepID=A0ABS4UVF8_9ACTN|nr:hypothetical protein [Kribbella aluminosa]MBP2355630.1 hypothetical protein [Kribbella aluminosa]
MPPSLSDRLTDSRDHPAGQAAAGDAIPPGSPAFALTREHLDNLRRTVESAPERS